VQTRSREAKQASPNKGGSKLARPRNGQSPGFGGAPDFAHIPFAKLGGDLIMLDGPAGSFSSGDAPPDFVEPVHQNRHMEIALRLAAWCEVASNNEMLAVWREIEDSGS
jgi:hypothetical protein